MQGHINHLAGAAIHFAVVQRHHHADHAMQRRQRVTNRDTHAYRHTPRFSRQVAQAAHGFANHTKTGKVTVRACLAVTRDAQNHQPGVDGVQLFGRHAPALQRAGSKVLDQHIGLGNQLARNVLGFFLAQIQRYRALVA